MKLPETGIEPVRVLPRRILSPVRLPIPPLGQILRCFSRSITIPNQPKFVNSFFRFFSFFHHQSLGKKKNKYLYLFWKWAEKDSNLRSYRNRFTVCPLWPLGNPTIWLKADERTRTVNLLITSQLLCQLSHIGIYLKCSFKHLQNRTCTYFINSITHLFFGQALDLLVSVS